MYDVTGARWLVMLAPTPELWTRSLPHRTAILYAADIAGGRGMPLHRFPAPVSRMIIRSDRERPGACTGKRGCGVWDGIGVAHDGVCLCVLVCA